jgi:rod shape-determining protein MreC
MIFNNNKYHNTKYFNSSNRVAGSVYGTFNSVINYFELAEINRELSEENSRLKTLLLNDPHHTLVDDSLSFPVIEQDSLFRIIPARVINNSVNNPHNYITLNKGRKHGVKPDQGIIIDKGIVGVVIDVSDSYAVGLSVLNRRWSISAKLKNTGYFGSLYWSGNDYRVASLMEIPFHVNVNEGDTVVTSGYSSVFPEGIMIGTIQSFDQDEGENYYNIEVELSTDFKSLSFVEIIDNINSQEIRELESLDTNDERIN